MKKLILTSICCLILTAAFSQDPKKIYEKGLEKAQAGKLEEAINLFSSAIQLQPEDYYSWYNRGIAESILNLYDEALQDFNQTIKLAPDYKKAYLNRGTTRKHLTDYEGAINDYTFAIRLDEKYAEAYYNRGLVYEMLGNDSACTDFNKANDLGIRQAEKKVEKCKNPDKKKPHSILRLTKTTDNMKYGFTPEFPVKVGTGPGGGPANNEDYLQLLRDPSGKPVKYERVGSCCAYDSPNGFMGKALLDHYEITFINEKGKKKKASVYISFYDYEEPLILYGFRTVGKK